MNKLIIRKDDPAVQRLASQDEQIKKLIQLVGDIEVVLRPNLFKSLVRSIIGQQISLQAANAVYGRLEALQENNLEAGAILDATDEELRSVGLSARKVVYLRDLAEKVHNGEIDLSSLHLLDNNAIIKKLTGIKGIGKWTAEMFLIFSLERMDVLAVDDIAIQRGAKWLYQVEQTERRKILIEKKTVWHPHLTTASFYLWETVHLEFVTKYKSIDEVWRERYE